jgi:hypothetical protein
VSVADGKDCVNVGAGGEPEAKTGMAAVEPEAEVISDRNESEATKPVVIAEPAGPKVMAAGVPPPTLPRTRVAFGKSLSSMGAVRPAWVRSFGENVGQSIRKESCHPRGVQQTRVMIDAIKVVLSDVQAVPAVQSVRLANFAGPFHYSQRPVLVLRIRMSLFIPGSTISRWSQTPNWLPMSINVFRNIFSVSNRYARTVIRVSTLSYPHFVFSQSLWSSLVVTHYTITQGLIAPSPDFGGDGWDTKALHTLFIAAYGVEITGPCVHAAAIRRHELDTEVSSSHYWCSYSFAHLFYQVADLKSQLLDAKETKKKGDDLVTTLKAEYAAKLSQQVQASTASVSNIMFIMAPLFILIYSCPGERVESAASSCEGGECRGECFCGTDI